MSSAGILLRVLLALSLVLNGIGGALASSEMSAASSHSATPARSGAGSASAHGCHEQAASGAHAGHGEPSPPPADVPAPDDCCGPGACSCACAQLPSLVAADSLFSPPRLQHEALSAGIGPAHPAPALPHLIRPPIA